MEASDRQKVASFGMPKANTPRLCSTTGEVHISVFKPYATGSLSTMSLICNVEQAL